MVRCPHCNEQFDTRTGVSIHSSQAHDEEYPPNSKLIETLKEFAEQLGHVPKWREMLEDGPENPGLYQDRFGTWNNALRKANVGVNVQREITDAEALQHLGELAAELNKTPSAKDMNVRGEYSHKTYENKFGSWNEAVEKAGLDTRKNNSNQSWQVGGNNPAWNSVRTSCDNCGTEMTVPVSRYEQNNSNYCSRECKYRGQVGLFSGADNPSYKHGEYKTNYGDNWDIQREKALERDGYECRACGMSQSEHIETYNSELHVHHVVPLRKFGDPEDANSLGNLVTACSSCHKKHEGLPVFPA